MDLGIEYSHTFFSHISRRFPVSQIGYMADQSVLPIALFVYLISLFGQTKQVTGLP